MSCYRSNDMLRVVLRAVVGATLLLPVMVWIEPAISSTFGISSSVTAMVLGSVAWLVPLWLSGRWEYR